MGWEIGLQIKQKLRYRCCTTRQTTLLQILHSNRKGLQHSTKKYCTLNLYHFFSWKQFNGNNYWQTILSNLSQKSIAIQTLMVSTEYDDRIVGLHENKPIPWRLSLSTPLDQPLLTHVIIRSFNIENKTNHDFIDWLN